MTRKEFTDLTSLQVTEKEFEKVNMVYMALDKGTKQQFCQMWKKMGDSAREYMTAMAEKHAKDVTDLNARRIEETAGLKKQVEELEAKADGAMKMGRRDAMSFVMTYAEEAMGNTNEVAAEAYSRVMELANCQEPMDSEDAMELMDCVRRMRGAMEELEEKCATMWMDSALDWDEAAECPDHCDND